MNIIKTSVIIAATSLLTRSLPAQPTSSRGWYERDDIQNVDIGWIKVLQFKEPAKPFAQHGWSYTAKQTGITQQFATWLHQTYTPRGYLGEMKLSLLAPEPAYQPDSKDYDYNDAEKNNRNALPNTYGAYGKLYMLLMKTPERKFWPINGMANFDTWYVMANNVELISQQLITISSADTYYCLMPKYRSDMKGEFEKEWFEQASNYRNFTNSPQLQPFEHYMIPAKQIDPGSEKYVVLLTKDKRPLPFDQVTVNELFNRIEAQLPMMYKLAIKGGSKLQNLQEGGRRGLQYLRDMYKNELQEFAYMRYHQIDIIDLFNLSAGNRPYWLRTKALNDGQTYFPLLRLRKGVKEALANGDPQWIVCRLDNGGSPANEGEIHRMDAFLQGFNYQYVYDYFFGKDKVIQPYKPLPVANGTTVVATAEPARQSSVAKSKSSDPAVVFYDDFSTVSTGTTPTAWNTQRSEITGDKIAVVEVKGADGKWLKLKRNASPKTLTQPVSGDVELSFDLLVQKGDVPWGTPGIEAELTFNTAQGDKKYTMNVSPGDMNRVDAAGWLMLNVGKTDCKMENYYSMPSFTGSKPINKVSMSFRKKGEGLTVLCNGNKVYDCAKVFVAGMNLKGFNFYVNEKNVFHLSNVQVKKI
ncbi:hypothetical protein [Paraflavitalea pollutisoli]|uniref:hypothetical protein n=1 Tax=Paraflavitalea pollutisoli TaxID=3034143 RepID=UPI0023EAE55B|nr:hypothetical protein [Paraflavitalea sp. H1-2-19X]